MDSLGFSINSWDSSGFFEIFNEYFRIHWDSRWILWDSQLVLGILWYFMRFFGIFWDSWGFFRILWVFRWVLRDFLGFSMDSWDFLGFYCNLFINYGFFGCVMDVIGGNISKNPQRILQES